MEPVDVVTVADARRGLSEILRTYRENPDAGVVIVGSRRRPEVVIVPVDRYLDTEARPRQTALAALQRQRELIRRIARLNRIDDVAVFGSVARGTETAQSDLDLLVTPSPDASLFDLAQFELDMEQLSGREVDAVSRHALDLTRDANILAEAVAL
jgi:predicted nucleotidyltransferase